MRILRAEVPGHEYDIHIGKGLLDKASEIIGELFSGKRIAVVTDSNVGPLYAKRLTSALGAYETRVITVEAGEHSKSGEVLFSLYDKLLDFGVTRTDMIIALGGGVVGDLTGFAAATLLRGIPYVQIPTTLLAQVDSSVGGKTAVNLERGKNLVGAFYQPKAVIIDTECQKTLPRNVLADGMAEVIKYGAISDSNFFEKLETLELNSVAEHMEDIIYTCCAIKGRIVEEDEHDTGLRMILNFGHTFGHGVERYYHYDLYTHGMGVAVGMVMACRWGENRGITPIGTADRMKKMLERYELPTETELPAEELMKAVSVDKKGDGDYINVIALNKIGEASAHRVLKSELYVGL